MLLKDFSENRLIYFPICQEMYDIVKVHSDGIYASKNANKNVQLLTLMRTI